MHVKFSAVQTVSIMPHVVLWGSESAIKSWLELAPCFRVKLTLTAEKTRYQAIE